MLFVEVVRKLNDGLSADKKIEFIGIDYAPPSVTADFMHRYFESERPAPSSTSTGLDPLHRIVNWLEISGLTSEERRDLLHTLKFLQQISEGQLLTSLPATLGLQITELIVKSSDGDEDFRDRVMAEAILALISMPDKERHIAIWAHSQHLAEGPIEGAVPMGHYLRLRLAEKYRAIGSMFYEGSFRTYSGLQEKLVNHIVTLPPPFFFESVMYRVSPSEACVFEVSEAARRSSVRDWISIPKHVRIYGGLEISESYPWPPVIVPDLWSSLIFVPSTAPTTPLD